MAQQPNEDFDIDPTITSGSDLSGRLNRLNDALISGRSGSVRPPSLQAGGTWLYTGNPTDWILRWYDGTVDHDLYFFNIATGKIKLNSMTLSDADDINLPSIDKIVNANTAVDVCLYIPSVMDDDNGEWINSANWQSWYGELGEFPEAGVLIVAESNMVTFYDLGYSSPQEWMVFQGGNGDYLLSSSLIRSVTMRNGVLIVGTQYGSRHIDFKNDKAWSNRTSAATTIVGYFKGNLAQRNTALGFDLTHISDLHNDTVNQVITTPNNITPVATDGGLSHIAADGSVSNWTDNGGGVNIVKNVAVDDNYVYWSTDNSAVQTILLMWPVNSPLVDSGYHDDSVFRFDSGPGGWTGNRIKFNYGGITSSTQALNAKAIASNRSLSLIYPDYDNGGDAMVCNITSEWNSGIMQGDIRGAWLASTSTDNLVGGEVADRSHQNKNLVVIGTLLREQVALGSELVGYYGFSATDYIELTDAIYSDTHYCYGWQKHATDGWQFKHGVVSAAPINGLTIIVTTLHIEGTLQKALIRVTATVPSAEKLALIEEQEGRLFHDDVKCTLQGTSSDVKAVSYDNVNELITACSADHVTRFNGLLVVDDFAEVATSVSTENNLIGTGV